MRKILRRILKRRNMEFQTRGLRQKDRNKCGKEIEKDL